MSDETARGPRVEVEETFEVSLPPEKVWEVVADTQHLNQLFFGIKPVEVVERDSFRARVRGLYGFTGPEFEELPWEFEAPRRFRLQRVFTRGIMKRTEFGAELERIPSGTKVTYRTWLETSAGPLGAVVRWGFGRQNRKAMGEVRALLAATDADTPVQWPPAYPYAAEVLTRAAPFIEELYGLTPGSRALVDELVGYLANAADYEVARMRPYELADLWEARRAEVLEVFLQATRVGLLQLGWDILCPSCENPPAGVEKLSDLPKGKTHCEACDITFDARFEESVEATFKSNPAVRESQNVMFCYGSPRRTPHWLAQFVVEPGGRRELDVELGAGRYRLQAAGSDGAALFEAGDEGDATAVAVIEQDGARGRLTCDGASVKAGRVSVAVENRGDAPRRVQLVHRRFASSAVLAPDITALGIFRDLFSNDVLAPDQSLEVGRTVILFTDLVGSTALYERIGDAAAYSLVRRHFEIMQRAIADHDGRIVKTIGDAVMATFPRAIQGARAAWQGIALVHAMQDAEGVEAELALKVGLHAGPCLAVEANNVADYFGRTVNIAARVQGLAGADELVLSTDVMAATEMQDFVDKLGRQDAEVTKDSRPIKGVAGEIKVVRVRMNTGPRTLEMSPSRSSEVEFDPDETVREEDLPPASDDDEPVGEGAAE